MSDEELLKIAENPWNPPLNEHFNLQDLVQESIAASLLVIARNSAFPMLEDDGETVKRFDSVNATPLDIDAVLKPNLYRYTDKDEETKNGD